MTDLPTRGEIRTEQLYGYSRTDTEARRADGVRTRVLSAYVDGVLMTREEWVARANFNDLEDRLSRHCLDISAASTCTLRQVEEWMAAALGDERR